MLTDNNSFMFDSFALMSAVNMDIFQNFAVVASFDTQAWQEFIDETKDYERTQPQTLIINSHVNVDNHVNHVQHENHNDHSNTSAVHTDTVTHTNNSSHNNSYGEHLDYSSIHTNQPEQWFDLHGNVPGYHSNYVIFSHVNFSMPHTNAHTDMFVMPHINIDSFHINGPIHTDTPVHDNATPHTDNTTPHSNTTPHGNSSPHDNTGAHNDTGFDHQNYIPSKPALFDMTPDKRIAGTVTIGLYSYDKNADGSGSQSQASKEARYDLFIRKTKKSDGTADVSGWRTLLNNSLQDANAGKTYDLNTIDPLGTGNTNPAATEGYYELKAVARNIPINGVTFNSQEQVLQVIIQQNQKPEVSVSNGDEVINFTFSKFGRLSPDGTTYNDYGPSLYSDPYSEQQNKYSGIFVVVRMKDADSANWQKGKAYLKDSGGNVITETDIIWSELPSDTGSGITASDNIEKKGYVFFSKDSLPDDTITQDAVIRIEVADYYDAACTQPTGDVTVRETVSAADSTILYVDIDTQAQAAIQHFTDRITGANNWLDADVAVGKLTEEEANELNTYFPNSEVVCKFEINPSGNTYQKYKVNFNANIDNTGEIGIDYIRLVKVDIGTNSTYSENPPINQSSNSYTLNFEISNPQDKTVAAYIKYRFKNNVSDSVIKQFTSRVAITPVRSDGTDGTTVNSTNIIRFRNTDVQYR